jgi:hypothetical protein
VLTFKQFPVLIVAARTVALAFAQITDQVIVTLRIAIEFGNECALNKDVLITQKTTALTTVNINVPIAHRLRSSAPSVGRLSVAYLST